MFLIGSIAKFSIQQFFFYYNYMYDIKELLSEKICYGETCLTLTNQNPVYTEL